MFIAIIIGLHGRGEEGREAEGRRAGGGGARVAGRAHLRLIRFELEEAPPRRRRRRWALQRAQRDKRDEELVCVDAQGLRRARDRASLVLGERRVGRERQREAADERRERCTGEVLSGTRDPHAPLR